MNRRAWINRLRGIGHRAGQGMLAAVLLGLVAVLGCTSFQSRAQLEDEVEHYYVETIGDKTTVGNATPIPVGGVGLVFGLEGTGGDCPPDAYRSMLETDLQKDRVPKVKEVLTDPRHALVLVSGLIPPGAGKGDPIDLELTLPRGSRVTSLRGGCLRKCMLFNYDFAERLNPDPNGPRGMLRGHPIVEAEGTLLVGLGDGDESVRVKARPYLGRRTLPDGPVVQPRPEPQSAICAGRRPGGRARQRDVPVRLPRRGGLGRGCGPEPQRGGPARAAAVPPQHAALPPRCPAHSAERSDRRADRQERGPSHLPAEAGRRSARSGANGDGRPAPGGPGRDQQAGPEKRAGEQASARALLLGRGAGLPGRSLVRRGVGRGGGPFAGAAGLRLDGDGVAGRGHLSRQARRVADDGAGRRNARTAPSAPCGP